MSTTDDGGPAFPASVAMIGDREAGTVMDSVDRGLGGMSLRDWFAGQALAGILGGPMLQELSTATARAHGDGEDLRNAIAASAVSFADAMIAARKAGGS